MSARHTNPDLVLSAPAALAEVPAVVTAPAGRLVPPLAFLFEGAWFPAALVSGVVYVVLLRRRVSPGARQAQEAAA